MNLRQLAYFRAVVEHGSLAAAADVLGVAQPNLSVAIKQLEAEWGVAIFDRVGRGLALTDTGRVLYERATQLLGNAAAVDQEMRAIGKGASARVRVGFTAVALDPITYMVAETAGRGASISFSLHQGEPRLLETMVEQRQLDFALTHLPVANPALHVLPMVALRLRLLARDDDARWARGQEIDLAELAQIPLILLKRSEGGGVFQQVGDAFAAAGVESRILADCTDMTVVQALVFRGSGVALVPMLSLSAVPSGLAAFPIRQAPELERLALIYPRARRLLPAVQAAMELCRDFLAGIASGEGPRT